MAGGTALLGDEAEHQSRVQQGGVGRRQVTGDKDIGLVAVGDTRHRDPQQTGDDTIPHVVEVGHATGEILTGAGQQLAVRGERVVHPALGRTADGDPSLHVCHQLGVLGHHGLRLEHRLGFTSRQVAPCHQVGRHSLHGLAGAPLFTLRLLRGYLLRGRLQHRRSHVPNLADSHTVAHADASQRCVHLTRLR